MRFCLRLLVFFYKISTLMNLQNLGDIANAEKEIRKKQMYNM